MARISRDTPLAEITLRRQRKFLMKFSSLINVRGGQ